MSIVTAGKIKKNIKFKTSQKPQQNIETLQPTQQVTQFIGAIAKLPKLNKSFSDIFAYQLKLERALRDCKHQIKPSDFQAITAIIAKSGLDKSIAILDGQQLDPYFKYWHIQSRDSLAYNLVVAYQKAQDYWHHQVKECFLSAYLDQIFTNAITTIERDEQITQNRFARIIQKTLGEAHSVNIRDIHRIYKKICPFTIRNFLLALTSKWKRLALSQI